MRKAVGFAVVGLLAAAAFSGVSIGQALSSGPAPVPAKPPDFSLRSLPPPPSPLTHKWVHLYEVVDLERLRETNFDHFLRARSILAAASEICQPGTPKSVPTRFDGDYVNCGGAWLTSNPPKKMLTFHLDDVGYIALVSVTVDGAKLVLLNDQAVATK